MPLARPKTDPSLNSGQQVEAGLLFVSVLVSKPEGFFEVNFDHGQALGRHGWTGFGAVFESEEAIDVRGSQFSPAYVQEHLAGRAAEAHTVFNQAVAIAPANKAGEAAESVARAIRAQSGCVAPANAYILSLQGAK